MKKLLGLIFLIFFLSSCASTGKEGADQLRKLLLEKKNQEALIHAKSEKFYKDEKDRLLKLIEIGSLHFLNGNHYQSLKSFDAAQELSQKLFTVSATKKVSTAIANDNADNYYGEKFELSMIRYYQALNHYLLFLNGKYESFVEEEIKDGKKISEKPISEKLLSDSEKRFHLQAARSVLIEWDSLLNTFKSTEGGLATYKDDLMAKLLGGVIHENLGSANDLQIAKNLYKSAKDILLKYYNLYPVFNKKFDTFKSDYEKLPNLNPVELKKYIEETEEAKKLISYIDERLEALSKNKLKNVHLILEDHFIERKTAKVVDIPLPLGTVPVGIASGDANFVQFTLALLDVATQTQLKFYFELPEIKEVQKIRDFKIKVFDENQKLIKEAPVFLINPLNSIGHFTLNEKSLGIAAKTGTRVLTKHLVAIGAAYTFYQSQKKSLGEPMAMLAASASYKLANKGIEESEKADLRSWSTIPRNFYMNSFDLPKGKYSIKIFEGDKELQSDILEIIDQKMQLKSFRILE